MHLIDDPLMDIEGIVAPAYMVQPPPRESSLPIRQVALTVAVALLPAAGCAGASDSASPDLVIRDARVLDVRAGVVLPGRSVVVDGGRIRAVLPGEPPPAQDTLDAAGRLLTPGLIDAHSHLAYLLGDSLSDGGGLITRLSSDPDSANAYRRSYARQYIRYGVTTVRDAGSAAADVDMLLEWLDEPRSWAPVVYPTGGALVSHEEGRTPFPGHRVVREPTDARRVVRDYHDRGIRHVKLYWRLDREDLAAALSEARRLGMVPTGHIDFQVVPFHTALDLGLDSFEHAYTVAVGSMTRAQFMAAWRARLPAMIGDRQAGRFYLGVMEYFHEVGRDNAEVNRLIDRLADATVTPTLHLFAQRLGLSYYQSPPLGLFDDTSGLTDTQLEHFREGYRILAGYVRRMHERGVTLAVGTDSVEPGKAVLSEMLLLHGLGLTMPEVFRAATLHGAAALGLTGEIGVVEPGARADLVLFERDPLSDPQALLGPRTVLRSGVIAHSPSERR